MFKITKSLAIILAVVAIAGVGTYALYSDTETITGSTFSADPMYLKIDSDPSSSSYVWSDGFANTLNPFAKVKPGSTGEQIIDIENVGDIRGNATFDLQRTSDWSNLADALNFHIYFDGNHDGNFDDTGLNGTVDQFAGPYTLGEIIGNSADTDVPDGKVASVKIKWSVPSSAGNEIMGDSVVINTVFGLNQIAD